MTRETAGACLAAGATAAAELARTGSASSGSARWASATRPRRARSPPRSSGRAGGGVRAREPGSTTRGSRGRSRSSRRALAVNAADRSDPVGVLAALGGFELALLAGVALGCAAERVPVVLDGFITGAAALGAARIAPAAARAMVASHRSPEPGHALVLDALGLEPLLDLGLRLGEGTGAALAIPIVRAALAILNEMASFDDAGVTDAGR